MTIDKIGMFYGKPISSMTREELLEFAEWSAKEIQRLQGQNTLQDFKIKSIQSSDIYNINL